MHKHKKQIRHVTAFGLALLVLCSSTIGFAATKTDSSKTDSKKATAPDISGQVTQSYNADPSVQIGMVVKFKDKDTTTVVPLNSENVSDLLGIVVPKDNAKIVLTPETITKQQVLVTNTGSFSVLVSTQNGPVKAGDYLTVSAIAGIAMKADDTQKSVLGKAKADFAGTSNVIGTVKLKDTTGKSKDVTIGRTQLDLKISSNPLYQKSADFVPGFAAKAAETISNKPVSVARIYLGMVLLTITAFVTAVLLYSGVRSGMIAVGRNPLSKKSIFRSLIQTVFAALIIFITGVLAVYLLLKL